MKRLTRIKLINWNGYINETVLIRGNLVSINGQNGAGKSAFYDAITYALTCTEAHFNKAADKKSKRTVEAYVRQKIDTENRAYIRNGVVISHVALEYVDEITKTPFIIGVVTDSKAINDTKSWWYKIDNTTLSDDLFIVNNRPKDRITFEATTPRIEVYKEPSEARKKLLNKLGRYHEKFYDIFPRALAFKPIDKIEDFITSFLLDEKKIDVGLLQENVRTFQDLEATVAKTKRQIDDLVQINTKYKDIKTLKDKRYIYEYIVKRSSLEEVSEKIDSLLSIIENSKDKVEKLEKQIIDLNKEINTYEEQKYALLLEEKSGDNKIRLDQVLSKLKECEIEKNKVELDVRKLYTLLDTLKTELNKLEKINNSIGTNIEFISHLRNELDEFIKSKDIDRVSNAIKEFTSNTKQIRDSQVNTKAKVEIDKRNIEKELLQLNKTIRELENKNLNYHESVNLLLNQISEDFKKLGKDDEPKVLCELLNIMDDSWQNAIEGYLNTQRFYILVKPENFNVAANTYERMKKTHKIHSVGIINAGGLEHYSKCQENTLASLITSDNEYAKRYINKLTGNVMLCNKVTELKKHNSSITKDCIVYNMNSVRAINPKIYKSPFIGAEAYKVQLTHAKEEKIKKTELFSALSKQLEDLTKSIQLIDSETIFTFKSKAGALCAFDDINEQIYKLKEEESELKKDRTLLDIIGKRETIEMLIKNAKDEYENKTLEKGALINQIKTSEFSLSNNENLIQVYEKELSQFLSNIPNLEDDAVLLYSKELNSKETSQIKDSYTKKIHSVLNKISGEEADLINLMRCYNDSYTFGGEASIFGFSMYEDELEKLQFHKLHRYEEKAKKAKEDAELEFKEQFLSKIRENIKTAQIEMQNLNSVLTRIPFGSDRYEFLWRPSKKYERYYKMIMDEFNLMGDSLFSNQFNEAQKEVIKELFEKLSLEEDDNHILKEFTDYRIYMDYDIRIHHNNGDKSLYSKTDWKNSGGEKQSPFYAAILSSFVQLYSQSIGGRDESMGLVLLDEAFNNMDGERIKGVLQFMSKLPLQVLIASPTEKIPLIQPHVDDTIIIYKTSNPHIASTKNFAETEKIAAYDI